MIVETFFEGATPIFYTMNGRARVSAFLLFEPVRYAVEVEIDANVWAPVCDFNSTPTAEIDLEHQLALCLSSCEPIRRGPVWSQNNRGE